MNQEMLKRICKAIIESRETTAVDTLSKTISVNREAITDENEFYSFILNCLVDNLYVVEDENEIKGDKLDDLSVDKFFYFETLVVSYPEIDFSEQLIKLANYNLKGIDKVILCLAAYEPLKDKTRKCLKENIGAISRNVNLITSIVDFSDFTLEDLEALSRRVSELNEDISKLIEKEKARLSQMQIDINAPDEEFRNKMEELRILKINRDSIISTIQIIIKNKGIDNLKISNAFLIPIFESEFIGESMHLKSSMLPSITTEVLKSQETLSSLDLPSLVDRLVEINSLKYARSFTLKMSNEQLLNTKNINSVVENILKGDIKKHKEFFEGISKSDVLYRISPKSILTILEFICAEKTRRSPVGRFNLNVNNEKLATLSARVYQVIRNSANKENKVENFYESFISAVIYSQFNLYDNSIIYILQNYKLDMNCKVESFENKESLNYLICKHGSKAVLREFLILPNLPLHVYGESESIDMFNVCLNAEENERAREISNNPDFEFFTKEVEAGLLTNGEYSLAYYPEYVDPFSQAASTIYNNKEKHPEFIEILKHAILNGRVRFLSLEASHSLEQLAYIDSELLEILKKKCINGDFIFIKEYRDDSELSMGLELATKKDIREKYFWLDPKQWESKVVGKRRRKQTN